MASKSRHYSPHKIYVRKIRKLQSKGLLGAVDTRKRGDPKVIRAFEKYADVLAGRAAVVRAPTAAKGRELRRKLGAKGTGAAIIMPKESKSEKFRYSVKADKITSTRPGYNAGETIKKTYGEQFKARPKNAKAYYTLRERTRGIGKLKRRTFSSFDEMLKYLQSYDINFEDVEDYIEVEEVEKGGAQDDLFAEKISRDRAAYWRRKKRQEGKGGRKKRRR